MKLKKMNLAVLFCEIEDYIESGHALAHHEVDTKLENNNK